MISTAHTLSGSQVPAVHEATGLPVIDAGILAYQPAWELQLQVHEQVLNGKFRHGAIILLEHPPVVTIGRRPDAQRHLLASPKLLETRGVEVAQTDRGGDITFHGPGQLVVYPIIPLNSYRFNLHSYMRFLEEVVIGTLAGFAVEALRDPSPTPATGVWVREPVSGADNRLAKICAVGIKVRRWVSFHGLALNVSTDLSYFDLINPCGLSRPVTSMHRVLGDRAPDMVQVKAGLTAKINSLLMERGVAHEGSAG